MCLNSGGPTFNPQHLQVGLNYTHLKPQKTAAHQCLALNWNDSWSEPHQAASYDFPQCFSVMVHPVALGWGGADGSPHQLKIHLFFCGRWSNSGLVLAISNLD